MMRRSAMPLRVGKVSRSSSPKDSRRPISVSLPRRTRSRVRMGLAMRPDWAAVEASDQRGQHARAHGLAALVDDDNRVLIAQRPPGKSMAGLWEFPGGKVGEGETPEAAPGEFAPMPALAGDIALDRVTYRTDERASPVLREADLSKHLGNGQDEEKPESEMG